MAKDDREQYLTAEGAKTLRSELEELKGPKRRALAERLRFAIKQGDLSENADYINAKEEQAFLEGRIQELQAVLREAIIVDEPEGIGEVVVGCTVVVAEDGREQEVYRLVGAKEADPRQGKISNESPIGQALLGKRAGEVAIANTPRGMIEMTILEIR